MYAGRYAVHADLKQTTKGSMERPIITSISRSGFFQTCRLLLIVCFFALAATVPRWMLLVVGAASKQDQAAGALLFHEKGCEYCHGPDGRGSEKAPDLSEVGKRLKREQIERQIQNGGAQMPAFGEALQPDEIRLLVDYLQAKRKASAVLQGKRAADRPKTAPKDNPKR